MEDTKRPKKEADYSRWVGALIWADLCTHTLLSPAPRQILISFCGDLKSVTYPTQVLSEIINLSFIVPLQIWLYQGENFMLVGWLISEDSATFAISSRKVFNGVSERVYTTTGKESSECQWRWHELSRMVQKIRRLMLSSLQESRGHSLLLSVSQPPPGGYCQVGT